MYLSRLKVGFSLTAEQQFTGPIPWITSRLHHKCTCAPELTFKLTLSMRPGILNISIPTWRCVRSSSCENTPLRQLVDNHQRVTRTSRGANRHYSIQTTCRHAARMRARMLQRIIEIVRMYGQWHPDLARSIDHVGRDDQTQRWDHPSVSTECRQVGISQNNVQPRWYLDWWPH